MTRHIILGVHITNRMKNILDVQKIFTEYGGHIKTRLGLHEVSEKFCSPNGLLILEMAGEEKKSMELADKLAAVEGIEVQKMIFDHP